MFSKEVDAPFAGDFFQPLNKVEFTQLREDHIDLKKTVISLLSALAFFDSRAPGCTWTASSPFAITESSQLVDKLD